MPDHGTCSRRLYNRWKYTATWAKKSANIVRKGPEYSPEKSRGLKSRNDPLYSHYILPRRSSDPVTLSRDIGIPSWKSASDFSVSFSLLFPFSSRGGQSLDLAVPDLEEMESGLSFVATLNALIVRSGVYRAECICVCTCTYIHDHIHVQNAASQISPSLSFSRNMWPRLLYVTRKSEEIARRVECERRTRRCSPGKEPLFPPISNFISTELQFHPAYPLGLRRSPYDRSRSLAIPRDR